jgi:predicted branched-subunit amino acid permease
VQLLSAGASGVVVVLAALIVNARMLLYGAALAPHAAAWSARWRWLGAYLLADPVYALAAARFSMPDGGGSARHRLLYYLGVGVTLWTAWLAMTGAGVLLAGVLPTSLHLELAAPLTFLLLLLPDADAPGVLRRGGDRRDRRRRGVRAAPGARSARRRRARASRSAQSSQVVMGELLTLVVIGVGTYAMRAAFLVTARRQPPALVARLLPHIGPAVLAAITLPALIAPRGSVAVADTVPALLAAAIAAVMWRRTKNLPVALFGGMALWWLASWALSTL